MTNSHMKKYEICTNALTPHTVDHHRMHNSSCNNHLYCKPFSPYNNQPFPNEQSTILN